MPALQERGYFQTDYAGDTFRERSGLALTQAELEALRAPYT
ncbi:MULTISPECIES: hypothetical protein [unclassified Microbacterium]|nr:MULTISPECIES: hypothetical protein [unclassified Microbacterium]MCR2808418.1 hypothetical protein [Microbacterium sp. zg.B185]WIM19137.1 hypothetical protein QNO12_16400 [Microbacterium sp. zg-B185]